MDVLAHGLWTNAVYQKTNKRDRWWAIFFGIMPDFPFLPVAISRIFVGATLIHGAVPPAPFVFVYRATHSLLIFALVALLVWLWRGRQLSDRSRSVAR